MSTLPILVTFITLIIFGYFSFLRIINHSLRSTHRFFIPFKEFNSNHIFQAVGLSGFLLILPSVSILLFWGWGSALCWLIVYHIMIESTVLQFMHHQRSTKESVEIDDTPISTQPHKDTITVLKFIFFVAISAASIHFLIYLTHIKAGLLIFLLLLIPMYRVQDKFNQMSETPQYLTFFILLFIALTLCHSFNVDVSGSISLFGIPINSHALISIGIIYCLFSAQNKPYFFSTLIPNITGTLIACLTPLLIISLAIANPAVDAPVSVNNKDNTLLPSLFSSLFFISFGFISLCITQSLNHHLQKSKRKKKLKKEALETHAQPIQYPEWQASRLILLLFSIGLLLILASSFGIGAWDTHFSIWPRYFDLTQLFKLSLDAIIAFSFQNQTTSLLSTFVIGVFALSALTILNNSNQQLLPLNENKGTPKNKLHWRKLFHPYCRNGLILVITFFLSHQGILFSYWLLCGVLAWILVCDHILTNSIEKLHHCSHSIKSNQASAILCFFIFMIGMTSVTLLTITCIALSWWALLITVLPITGIILFHWLPLLKQLYSSFTQPEINILN